MWPTWGPTLLTWAFDAFTTPFKCHKICFRIECSRSQTCNNKGTCLLTDLQWYLPIVCLCGLSMNLSGTEKSIVSPTSATAPPDRLALTPKSRFCEGGCHHWAKYAAFNRVLTTVCNELLHWVAGWKSASWLWTMSDIWWNKGHFKGNEGCVRQFKSFFLNWTVNVIVSLYYAIVFFIM